LPVVPTRPITCNKFLQTKNRESNNEFPIIVCFKELSRLKYCHTWPADDTFAVSYIEDVA
jgi:hypothetical protein